MLNPQPFNSVVRSTPVNFAKFYFYDIFQIYEEGLPLYSARTLGILDKLIDAGCPIDSRDQQVGHF